MASRPELARRRNDDANHAAFIAEMATTFEAAVEEAVDRAVARHVAPLRAFVEAHIGNREVHPDGESFREMKQEHRTLWDERNETRGLLKIGLVLVSFLTIVSPFLAVFLSYYLTTHKGP